MLIMVTHVLGNGYWIRLRKVMLSYMGIMEQKKSPVNWALKYIF